MRFHKFSETHQETLIGDNVKNIKVFFIISLSCDENKAKL